MDVEIWVELTCPWSYLGKRRFETALAGFDPKPCRVVWRSFQLDPDRTLGTDDIARVTELAAGEGLDYALDRAHPANTRDAHRLVHYARSVQAGSEGTLVERLMRAYTMEGRRLDDLDTLAELAADVGLDEAEVREQLASDAFHADVLADQARAGEREVTGVPAFLFGTYGISGAQPPDVFAAMLKAMKLIGG